MWVVAASPLLVSTDLRNMTSIMKELLLNKQVLAVHQDLLGKAGDRVATDAGCSMCEVWARPLSGGALAVALYNSGEDQATVSVSLSDLGLKTAHAHDLWAAKDLGVVSKLSAALPAHGVQFLRLTPTVSPAAAARNSLVDFGYFWGRSSYDAHWGPGVWPELAAFAGHTTTAIVMNGGANATAMAMADILAIKQLLAKNMTAILGTPGNVLTLGQQKMQPGYEQRWHEYLLRGTLILATKTHHCGHPTQLAPNCCCDE